MSAAEPFGETRADIRSAICTVAAVVNGGIAQIPESEVAELLRKLVGYLDADEAETVSPDQAVRLLG